MYYSYLQAITLSYLKLLELKAKGENVFSVKCLECGEDVGLATFRQY